MAALSGEGAGDPVLYVDSARNRRSLVLRAVTRRSLQVRALDDGADRGRGRGLRSREPPCLAARHPHLGRRDRRAERCRGATAVARLGLGAGARRRQGGVSRNTLPRRTRRPRKGHEGKLLLCVLRVTIASSALKRSFFVGASPM